MERYQSKELDSAWRIGMKWIDNSANTICINDQQPTPLSCIGSHSIDPPTYLASHHTPSTPSPILISKPLSLPFLLPLPTQLSPPIDQSPPNPPIHIRPHTQRYTPPTKHQQSIDQIITLSKPHPPSDTRTYKTNQPNNLQEKFIKQFTHTEYKIRNIQPPQRPLLRRRQLRPGVVFEDADECREGGLEGEDEEVEFEQGGRGG